MKKFNKILLILVTLFFASILLSGCWDANDINQRTILTTIVLDKKDGEIYLYTEVANIEGNNKVGGIDKKFLTIYGSGKTILEARENLESQFKKEIYISAVRTIILTENFAKEYLIEYLHRARSNEFYRKKAVTLITRDDPIEFLKIYNDKNVSVGFSSDEIVKTLKRVGESFTRTTTRLLENLSDDYTGILIPCIGIKGKQLILTGYSVVNSSTVNGFIPIEQSKGMIFQKAKKPNYQYDIPYKDNKFTIKATLKNKKVKPSYKDGKVSFDMKFSFDAELLYGNKKTPYNFNNNSKAELTEIVKNVLKDELTNAIYQAQNVYKCDYLQFDDEFRIKYPTQFDNMNWGDEFSKASFNVDVKVKLTSAMSMEYETDVRK